MPYPLRFMIDCGIVGMSWLTVQRGTYILRKESEKVTNCQIEIDVKDFNDVYCNHCTGDFA